MRNPSIDSSGVELRHQPLELLLGGVARAFDDATHEAGRGRGLLLAADVDPGGGIVADQNDGESGPTTDPGDQGLDTLGDLLA